MGTTAVQFWVNCPYLKIKQVNNFFRQFGQICLKKRHFCIKVCSSLFRFWSSTLINQSKRLLKNSVESILHVQTYSLHLKCQSSVLHKHESVPHACRMLKVSFLFSGVSCEIGKSSCATANKLPCAPLFTKSAVLPHDCVFKIKAC